jgi:hypothetical protein
VLVTAPPPVVHANVAVDGALVETGVDVSETVGGVATTVQAAVAEPEPVALVAVTTYVWAPSARPVSEAGEVHAAAVPLSSLQVVEVGLLVAVHAIDAVVAVVEPDGALVMVTTGAGSGGGCTVHAVVVAEPVPAMLVAETVTECEPTARLVIEYGLVQAAAVPPSSEQVTLVGLLVVVNETTPDVDVEVDGWAVIVTTGIATIVQAAVAEPEPVALVAVTTTVCAPAARPE